MTIITDVPSTGPIDEVTPDGKKIIRQPWMAWFKQVFLCAFSVQDSGTTAQRPTSQLWVGRRYFDTTVDQPVWFDGTNWVTWPGGGGGTQTGIQWQDEGVNLGTSGTVSTVNITGGPITATRSVNTVQINVDNINTGPPYTSLIYECWGAGGGAGASAFPFGAGIAVTAGGTFQIQEPTPNTTNIWDIFWRSRSPGTGVGSVTGFSLIRALQNKTFWRGNAANLGGFKIYAMWAVTTAFASNAKGFFGMTDRNTATLTIDPSTAGDGFFGVGADAADANWQVMRGTSGGGNFTKVDTGILKTSAAGIYTLATYCTPNSSSMLIKFSYWANGGTTVTIGTGANDTSYTTNLPGATASLQAIYNLSSAGNQPTVDFIYSRVVIPIAAVLSNTF